MPNRLTKTASQLAHAIKLDIKNAEHEPGWQLPAERQMAEQYNSSRGTIRAALTLLEEQSLVTRKAGSGTYLQQPSMPKQTDFADLTNPMQLMAVRETIEPAIVEMAVHHASHRDLKLLEECLDRLEQCDDPSSFSQADEAFHLAIARSCGNPLMLWIYEQINEIRHHELWRGSRKRVLQVSNMAIYNQHHRLLYEAIKDRHVEAARNVMLDHLTKARNDLIQ